VSDISCLIINSDFSTSDRQPANMWAMNSSRLRSPSATSAAAVTYDAFGTRPQFKVFLAPLPG